MTPVALSVNDQCILDGRVRPLVTAELIAEQRESPFGPQSPGLTEVMDFVRRSPDPDLPRYIVLDTPAGFVIAARSPTAGQPPVPLDPPVVLPSRAGAEHTIFRFRLTDYGLLA